MFAFDCDETMQILVTCCRTGRHEGSDWLQSYCLDLTIPIVISRDMLLLSNSNAHTRTIFAQIRSFAFLFRVISLELPQFFRSISLNCTALLSTDSSRLLFPNYLHCSFNRSEFLILLKVNLMEVKAC